jgi:hypothetical protein
MSYSTPYQGQISKKLRIKNTTTFPFTKGIGRKLKNQKTKNKTPIKQISANITITLI